MELSVSHHEAAIRISVSDRGPGIPEEFRTKIFDKFSQVDSSDTRKKGGTGLGLNIASLIMEKHDGRIDYISREGGGVTFYIELPVPEMQ